MRLIRTMEVWRDTHKGTKGYLFMHTIKISIFFILTGVFLAGCGATNNSRNAPILVGPTYNEVEANKSKTYSYDSDIFLDVAIPVFEPGFPLIKSPARSITTS